jgi:hypothetical protein
MPAKLDQAIQITGWDPKVVDSLYAEYMEQEDDGENFLEFIANEVGNCAFIIAASNGMTLEQCLVAYEHGVASVLDEDFSVDDAIDQVYEASSPE